MKSIALYILLIGTICAGTFGATGSPDTHRDMYASCGITHNDVEIRYRQPFYDGPGDTMLYSLTLRDSIFEYAGFFPGIVKYICKIQPTRPNITPTEIRSVLNDSSLNDWRVVVLEDGEGVNGKSADNLVEYIFKIMLTNSPVIPDFGKRRLAMKDNPFYEYYDSSQWESIEVSLSLDFEENGDFHGHQAVKVTRDSVFYRLHSYTSSAAISDSHQRDITDKLRYINCDAFLSFEWPATSFYSCQVRVDNRLIYSSFPGFILKNKANEPYERLIEYILSLSPQQVRYFAEG